MSYMPEAGVDLKCTVVGWADGAPADVIRVPETPLQADLVLLHCTTRLEMDHFPAPRKFHSPPNNQATTTISEEVHMLAYNGLPSYKEDIKLYPCNTTKKEVLSAYRSLYPDSLSWSKGPTEPQRYVPSTVFYKISTFCGALGAGIFNAEGKLIGSALSSRRAD